MIDGPEPSGWFLTPEFILGHENDAAGTTFIQYQGIETTDVIIDAELVPDVTISDTVDGPYFFTIRRTDADNYVFMNLDAVNGLYGLWERIAGVDNQLQTWTYTAGTIPHVIHMDVRLGQIVCSIDGVEKTGVTTLIQRGMLGITSRTGQSLASVNFVQNWQFILLDDFKVEVAGTITGLNTRSPMSACSSMIRVAGTTSRMSSGVPAAKPSTIGRAAVWVVRRC